MFRRTPKIPNPKIKEFERNIKKRGFTLVEANFFSATSIIIGDGKEFRSFAKRSQINTVFRLRGHCNTHYFYIVNGHIIRIYFPNKVRVRAK